LDYGYDFKRMWKYIHTVRLPKRIEIKQAAQYVLLNLAGPLGFYLTFHWIGPKAAIGLAISITLIQVIVHWIYSLRFSPIFIVAAGFTVLFGSIDLFLESPQFFRLEPFAQNLVVGTVFLLSLLGRVPVVVWFASGLPEPVRPDLSVIGNDYLRKLTFLWGIYFCVKAGIFFYLAYQVDLGSLVVLRSLIGGGSLVLMFVGEIIYRKWIRK
jgi:uncharacterized membrane protein